MRGGGGEGGDDTRKCEAIAQNPPGGGNRVSPVGDGHCNDWCGSNTSCITMAHLRGTFSAQLRCTDDNEGLVDSHSWHISAYRRVHKGEKKNSVRHVIVSSGWQGKVRLAQAGQDQGEGLRHATTEPTTSKQKKGDVVSPPQL